MANDKNVKKEKKRFSKDFKVELKKVTWPTGKQLVNNTVAVISIVAITAAIVFVLDLGFETLNKYGINKLKSSIKNNNQTETVVESTATPEATVTEEPVESNETTENNEAAVAQEGSEQEINVVDTTTQNSEANTEQ